MKRTKLLREFLTYCNKIGFKISISENKHVNLNFYSLHFTDENKVSIIDKLLSKKYLYEVDNLDELLILFGNNKHFIDKVFKSNSTELKQFEQKQIITQISINLPYNFIYIYKN